jgi:UDP-GlcNAc:undecaprenyl-phosphate/decaprenyl-phosphate GlcNAc-1-phosphate transferase
VNPLIALTVFLGAGLLSGLFVWISIKIAHRFNFLDSPDVDRKNQVSPIPKLGGIAVAVAFTLTVILVLLVTGRTDEVSLALSVLIPALGLAIVGFFDDRGNLNPYFRLFMQAAFGLLAWLLGIQFDLTGIAVLDALGFVVWVMLIVNGVNLLDNSDGLAASTVIVSSVGAAIIAVIYGQTLVSILALALAGSALGFLGHNWFPAHVYMGDAGAYFLGFLLAVLAVRLQPEGASAVAGMAIAILIVLLPIVDTIYVVTKRLANGIHPFTSGCFYPWSFWRSGTCSCVTIEDRTLLVLILERNFRGCRKPNGERDHCPEINCTCEKA